MELLSPAGNIQSAYASFLAGADAIYCGGKKFSARANAENFSNDELKEITEFAHSIGKKVYVTLNTLLFQDEFFEAVEFANFLYRISIDGLIIQDLGLASYLHKTIPGLSLNASTQLNCHNIDQAKALIKIGFKRIVLAREANIEIIKKIKELGVEVEVFGHGALCVSYSGNCLMSSFIGGRSGNRGKCAQPCRMEYSLAENGKIISNNTFAISTKDLNTLDYIQEFIKIGVDSLKIEGRLKSTEYIYSVTKAYRHAIDNIPTDEDKLNLQQTFNRQFTKGFVFDQSPFEILNTRTSSHQGIKIGKVINAYKNRLVIKLFKSLHRLDGIRFDSKEQFGITVQNIFLNKKEVEEAKENDIIELAGIDNSKRFIGTNIIKTSDYQLSAKINSELKKKILVEINGEFKAVFNEKISLKLNAFNHTVSVFGDFPQHSEGNGTSEDRIIDQMSKSGNSNYKINLKIVELDKCFIPISELNSLRNKALQELKIMICKQNDVQPNVYTSTVKKYEYSDKISAIFTEQTNALDDIKTTFKSQDVRNINTLRVNYSPIFYKENALYHYICVPTAEFPVASQYCNATNSYTLDCFYEFGFKQIIVSTECDKESIDLMISDFRKRHGFNPNLGIIAYGKIDLMIMKSCPIGTYYNNQKTHCGLCHKNKYELIDRIKTHYSIIGDTICNIHVLNDRPIYLLDKKDELFSSGINTLYLLLTDENELKQKKILEEIQESKTNFIYEKYTRGHYLKRPL